MGLLSSWLDRWSSYKSGQTTVIPGKVVVKYRHKANHHTYEKQFLTSMEADEFVDQHRRKEVHSNGRRHCTQRGDWDWFEVWTAHGMVTRG